MFVECSTFLLTGLQVVNRFIDSNISANFGWEQLLSYGHTQSTVTYIRGNAISDATFLELGVDATALGKVEGKVKKSTPSNIGKNMKIYGRENMGEAVSPIMT